MFTSDAPLSLSTLILLKWTDANGHQLNFRLINIISSRWREFGYLFGREENELENLREECFGKANRCWCKVMNQWLENDGTPEYPATWRGVLTVLVDLQYSEVARELQRVLASVTPPPPPPRPQVAQPASADPFMALPLDPGKTPLPEPARNLPNCMSQPPLQPGKTPPLVLATPPEPARTPPSVTPPLEPDGTTPDVTTEPARTPPSVTPPLEPDGSTPEPVRTPPFVTTPLEPDGSTPEPARTPPFVTTPLEPDGSTPEPVRTPPSVTTPDVTTEPARTPPSVTPPLEPDGSTPEPVRTPPFVTPPDVTTEPARTPSPAPSPQPTVSSSPTSSSARPVTPPSPSSRGLTPIRAAHRVSVFGWGIMAHMGRTSALLIAQNILCFVLLTVSKRQ